jgi:hypothetical protein
MFKYYPLILGIMDTIDDWNEKLNSFAASHMDNVWFGAAAVGVIFLVGCWGVNTLNKK